MSVQTSGHLESDPVIQIQDLVKRDLSAVVPQVGCWGAGTSPRSRRQPAAERGGSDPGGHRGGQRRARLHPLG